jgi:peptidoglycan/xylan/chitin deacetylase (PgdA/CDA1 family)
MVLFGCAGHNDTAAWHAASTGATEGTGGTGGGDGTATLVSTRTTESGAVRKTTGGTEVALTFDDGPDPAYTPQLLALLRKHDVKATFCLVGKNVQAHPDLVRAIVADGHALCNHTWNHDLKLGTRGEAAIRADLQRTNDAIKAAVPDAEVKYFRHPGGMWTPAAVKVAADLGMVCAGWEVDPTDWNVAKWSAGAQMKQHVLAVLRAEVKPGSIVLSHDAGGDRSGTLAAYTEALPELKAKYTLAKLS